MVADSVLEGMSVVMLVGNNVYRDGRVQKEALSLTQAGADVCVIAGLDSIPPEFTESVPYKVVPARPVKREGAIQPRLGMDDVWLPLRAAVNLTVTRYRESKVRYPFEGIDPEFDSVQYDMIDTAHDKTIDVVHCHDLDMLYTGYLIAQKHDAKLVYDSHELFLEMGSISDEARAILSEVEKSTFPKVDAFITVSPEIASFLCEKYNHPDLEPVVLYNGGAMIVEEITPTASPVKLFFQGSFSESRNLKELIESMVFLQDEATLTLQGWGGRYEEELQVLISELCLESVVEIIPPSPPLEVVRSASEYDIGLYTPKMTNRHLSLTLPNKLFDYMCAGLAVACTDFPSVKAVVDAAGCGITFEQKGSQYIAKNLKRLVSDTRAIDEMKKASLRAATNYSWDTQGKKLVSLYKSLKS